MKNIFVLMVLFFGFITSDACSEAMKTTSNLNLRISNSTNSLVLYTIPKGKTVDVMGRYGSWYYVYYAGVCGFVYSSYVKPETQSYSTSRNGDSRTKLSSHNGNKEVVFKGNSNSGVRYYTNSRGCVVQSPTHYRSVPIDASARCRDGSYSFSHSRRGTCSHHGGVAVWY